MNSFTKKVALAAVTVTMFSIGALQAKAGDHYSIGKYAHGGIVVKQLDSKGYIQGYTPKHLEKPKAKHRAHRSRKFHRKHVKRFNRHHRRSKFGHARSFRYKYRH